MPNRYSEVNNCPECRHQLWLSKRKGEYWYNCLHCGYEYHLEQPKVINPQTVFEQSSFWDELAVAAYEEGFGA